ADGSRVHRYPSPSRESRANDAARACSASMVERSSGAIAPPSAFAFKTRNRVSRNLIARPQTWAAARGDAAAARRSRAAWPRVIACAASSQSMSSEKPAIDSAPEDPRASCPELQKSRHKAPPGQRNVSRSEEHTSELQ